MEKSNEKHHHDGFKRPVWYVSKWMYMFYGILICAIAVVLLDISSMINIQINDDGTEYTCTNPHIDATKSDELIGQFESHYPSDHESSRLGTWGGKICKQALQDVLDDMSSGEDLVHFRLGYSIGLPAEFTKGETLKDTVCLILSAGELKSHGSTTTRVIVRNGYDNDKYCPVMCD